MELTGPKGIKLDHTFMLKLDHTSKLSKDMGELCMSPDYSDVTFIIKGEKLHAHKIILAKRSEYFHSMFFGNFEESSQKEIDLDVPLNEFKVLLKYMYTGSVTSVAFDDESILEFLKLAHEYQFGDLVAEISTVLVENLSLKNCCAFINAAFLYDLQLVKDAAIGLIDQNSLEWLKVDEFKALSCDSLRCLLKNDAFYAPEIQIFFAVIDWCRNNSEVDAETVLPLVRFALIEEDDLLTVLNDYTEIVGSERIQNMIREQRTMKTLPYRCFREPGLNVAAAEFNAKTIRGENPLQLLSGFNCHWYTKHQINESNDNCIMVKLGRVTLINYIKLFLHTPEKESYSYYIDISIDNEMQWDRIVDYSEYHCRSWQSLYFEARPVRYIKLVGTRSSSLSSFNVVALKAYYETEQPTMIDGFTSPTYNVSTKDNGALVIEGKNWISPVDVMLKGDRSGGITYHEIGKGSIIVQLAQPYHIGSLRMLLLDNDDRKYSFYIETSTNKQDWQMAVDKRYKRLQSRQQFTFEPRPVTYIKMVGTYCSYNNNFNVVHFETP